MSDTASAPAAKTVDFGLFDADNHYYESPDAFTRFAEPEFARRGVQWIEVRNKPRLMVNGKLNRFIPNPMFDPVARPGCLDDYFRGKTSGDDIRAAFGELEPISPSYRNRDARLEVMDAQGMDGCFMFPTLGVGLEEALLGEIDLTHSVFRSFNRWVDDDWGFAYADRIYAAPYIVWGDPDQTEAEVAWAIERGARVLVMRASPAQTPTGPASPGDERFDGSWRRISEAGVCVAVHSGDAGYHKYAADWGEAGEMEAFRYSPFQGLTGAHRAVYDLCASLICSHLFARFDNLRIATIESGSDWVPDLLARMKKSYRQIPGAYSADPVETFRKHFFISPYYEDDLRGLAGLIGADRVIMGSDFPHAEGLAVPAAFINDLDGFDDAEVRLIMRENALGLSRPG